MDLALTARTIGSSEALRVGLVTQVVSAPGQAAVLGEAVRLATQLAAKPPLASIGTKRVLLHTRCGQFLATILHKRMTLWTTILHAGLGWVHTTD
jgi:enoyl-CoA hydratase/carnithine racemase